MYYLFVVMRLNFNQFFIFLSALYKLLHILAESFWAHTHTAHLSLCFIKLSPHTRSWVQTIHETLYPCQRRTHCIVPVEIVAVIHCTVTQPKSGEERIEEGREKGRRERRGENKRGDRGRRREKKWRDGRREWGEEGGVQCVATKPPV